MKRLTIVLALALVGSPGMIAGARAQQGAVELGADIALSYGAVANGRGGGSQNVFRLAWPIGGDLNAAYTPFGGLRVGYHVSRTAAIETNLAVSHTSSEGSNMSAVNLATKLRLSLAREGTASRGFVAFGPTLGLLDFDGEGAHQFGVCGEIGSALPLGEAARLRLAVGAARLFESDDMYAQTVFYTLCGFSTLIGGS